MSNIVYWIWLGEKHLGVKARRALFQRFDSPKDIYFADRAALADIEMSKAEHEALLDKDLKAAERIIARCAEENVSILTLQDAAYPERLRNIPDVPCVLYVKGHLPAVDTEPVIGVVGTRKCTPYGQKMAYKLGYEIAAGGGTVVTGLAEGADSRAAEGALRAGGKVIGVLGTAINVVFPSFNRRLFEDVAAAGAIISEYPPDTPGNKLYFPIRNRIIAGLSLGVVIAEAPKRSGALITARHALESGRDVFAVPANVDAPNAKGSNDLLREGAIYAGSGWDVLKEYQAQFPDKISEKGKKAMPEELQPNVEKPEDKAAPGKGFFKLRVPVRRAERKSEGGESVLAEQLEGLTENQLKIVAVMKKPSMHVDDIIDLSALPASTVLSELTMLQIKGFVTQEAGKRFTLNIAK